MVIFPDVEMVLVAGLKTALASRTEPVADSVHVSTIKPAPDVSPYPTAIVTIRSDGGPVMDDVRKTERIGINVWCSGTQAYENASELAHLVTALMKSLTGDSIKYVNNVLSPIRIDEESTEEHRYMTFELIVKGSTL